MLLRPALFSALILLAWFGSVGGRAADSQPSEYQLKAAYLYHFAQFVDWPASAFSETNSPMVIGIIGQNPFSGDLEQAVRGKAINSHPLEVKEIRTLTGTTNNCHIVFISASEKDRLAEIFTSLRGTSVLTVGETERFTEAGGMINFVTQGKKIRFQINEAATREAKLKVSSKLLNLAIR